MSLADQRGKYSKASVINPDNFALPIQTMINRDLILGRLGNFKRPIAG